MPEENEQQNGVWPPPPTSLPGKQISIARPYLTYAAWLDTILGVLTGFVFNGLLFYAVTTYVLYFLIPHRISFFWNVVVGCIITLFILGFIWSRLRLHYSILANGAFVGGVLLDAIVLILFQPV